MILPYTFHMETVLDIIYYQFDAQITNREIVTNNFSEVTIPIWLLHSLPSFTFCSFSFINKVSFSTRMN